MDHRRERQVGERTDGDRQALTARPRRALLFAPGAGAPSSSAWMQAMKRRFEALGSVECFDYPYQVAGRRSPDRHPVLVQAHDEAYERLKASHSGPIVLVGKSMGGRIGCHVAVASAKPPAALVCLGYPLVGSERQGSRRSAPRAPNADSLRPGHAGLALPAREARGAFARAFRTARSPPRGGRRPFAPRHRRSAQGARTKPKTPLTTASCAP